MTGRTWLVLANDGQDERTAMADAEAAMGDGGLSVYVDKIGLPAYLGVWLAPNGGHYHLYSDYPPAQHERFGWTPAKGKDMNNFCVVERRINGQVIRHEAYADRKLAETRAAERANELSDNSPTVIQAEREFSSLGA